MWSLGLSVFVCHTVFMGQSVCECVCLGECENECEVSPCVCRGELGHLVVCV